MNGATPVLDKRISSLKLNSTADKNWQQPPLLVGLEESLQLAQEAAARRCKTVSVNCLSSIRFHPSGVRRSDGERSEPSAAEPRRGEAAPREKLVEGGPHWFPVGVLPTHPTNQTKWPTTPILNS